MKEVRFLDAFSGIGGFRVAGSRAATSLGIPHSFVASIEIDRKARAVYKANFGDEPLEDITKIDPVDLPDFDFLLAGFPCPVFSRNGKYYNQSGVAPKEDPRTDLFYNLVDILKAKKPSAFVLENVKEIKTIRHYSGVTMEQHVLSSLKELGYFTSSNVLDSKHFGLAQQRKRCYFSGLRRESPPPFKTFTPNEFRKVFVKDIMDADADPKLLVSSLWANRKGGIPTVLAKKIKDKNLKMEKLVKALEKAGDKEVSRLELLSIAVGCGQWQAPADKHKIIPVAVLYGMTPSALPRQQDKLYSVEGISPTIATFSTPAFDHPKGWRILSPRECARLQGFDDSFILPKSNNDAYRCLGNAVSVNVAETVISGVLETLIETRM